MLIGRRRAHGVFLLVLAVAALASVLLLASGPHAATAPAVAHALPTAATTHPGSSVAAGCSPYPWDWGSCVSDAWNAVTGLFGSLGNVAASYIEGLVETVVLWMYSAVLGAVVWAFVSAGQYFGYIVDVSINGFAYVASLLGVFALPVLTICLVGLGAALTVAWEALKDTPVVGGLA